MFTGLIEAVGEIASLTRTEGCTRLTVSRPGGFDDIKLGDSISVDGCCLSIVAFDEVSMSFDLSKETLTLTDFRNRPEGSQVNLERALKLGERLGGHLVTGHVDTCGQVVASEPQAAGRLLEVRFAKDHSSMVVEKGSIAIDGVSLTINNIRDMSGFCICSLMLIPITLEKTSLGGKAPGDLVHLEWDILGKYIIRDHRLRSQKE